MLSSMPGKGLGMAAKRIGEAASRSVKANPKMDFVKNSVGKMKSSLPKKNLPAGTPKVMGQNIGGLAKAALTGTAAGGVLGGAASTMAKALRNRVK